MSKGIVPRLPERQLHAVQPRLEVHGERGAEVEVLDLAPLLGRGFAGVRAVAAGPGWAAAPVSASFPGAAPFPGMRAQRWDAPRAGTRARGWQMPDGRKGQSKDAQ